MTSAPSTNPTHPPLPARRRARRSGRFVFWLFWLALACPAVVAASQPASPPPAVTPSPALSLRPLEERIYVLPEQRTLVVPVQVDPGARGGPMLLRAKVAPVPARLAWVAIDLTADAIEPALSRGRRDWIGRPGRWFTAPAPRAAGEPGFWVLVIDLASTPAGAVIDAGGDALPLVWLDAAPARSGDVLDAVAAAVVPRDCDRAALAGMLEPALKWPTERWRAGAITQVLLGKGGSVGTVRIARHGDPDLDALAVQVEGRWRRGLSLLADADASTARRLAGRMLAVADFGSGVAAPVWPGENSGMGLLLDALLDPRLDPSERAAQARAFLTRQPAAVAWVIDDAPTATGGAALGLLSIDPSGTTVQCAPSDFIPHPPEPFSLPLLAAYRLVLATAAPNPGSGVSAMLAAAAQGDEALVMLGRSERRLRLLDRAFPAAPPGLDIGPLVAEWNLSSWLAAQPRSPAAAMSAPREATARSTDWLTAGRLMRSEDGAWMLYIECACGPGADGTLAGEVVSIWTGLAGGGPPALRLAPMADGAAAAPSPGARIMLHEPPGSGWSVWVTLPPGVIPADGLLRLAVERSDARGVRSTWPRAVLPWQVEPGRITVDLNTWAPRP